MAHPKAAELAGTLQAHPHFDKARGLLLQAATPKAQIVGGRCDGGAWLPSLLRCSPCCIALPPPRPPGVWRGARGDSVWISLGFHYV